MKRDQNMREKKCQRIGKHCNVPETRVEKQLLEEQNIVA